jgi:hypothetical protein
VNHAKSGQASDFFNTLLDLVEIDIEDRHIEDVGAVAVLIVDMDEPDGFFAEIDLDGIVELGARAHVDTRVVEFLLQVLLQLDDLRLVHEPVLGCLDKLARQLI